MIGSGAIITWSIPLRLSISGILFILQYKCQFFYEFTKTVKPFTKQNPNIDSNHFLGFSHRVQVPVRGKKRLDFRKGSSALRGFG